MNLFLVHHDPVCSARLLADADPIRARKQLLEGLQLLASADLLFSGKTNMMKADGQPYKLAHQHHPITKHVVANKHQWELARDIAQTLSWQFPKHACARSFKDWFFQPSKLCRRHHEADDPEVYCLCRKDHPVLHPTNRIDYAHYMRDYCINYKGMIL